MERKWNKTYQLELLKLKILNHVQLGYEFVTLLGEG